MTETRTETAAGSAGTARAPRRRVPAGPALPGVLGIVIIASLLIGAHQLPVGDAVSALSGKTGFAGAVLRARLARTALALAVGAALGVAGALMQGLTRNPLADPGILGINAGAAFAVVVAIAVFGLSNPAAHVGFAFTGAALAMLFVHTIATFGPDGATPAKIAIAGAALTAAVTSGTSGILLTDHETMDSFRLWQVGTVGGRGIGILGLGLPFLAAGVVLALGSARALDTLALGDDLARGMGRKVWRDRLVVGTAITLLAGTATALAGPVGFVGLIVPHAIRLMCAADYARTLALSLGYGAALTVAADVVGRVIAPPGEVQVGIMTAVLGAPVFLWVVRRGRFAAL